MHHPHAVSETALNPHWLAVLHASADRPPLRPRLPLLAGAQVIGSVEPDFINKIILQPLPDGRHLLQKDEHSGGLAWAVLGELSASLDALAHAMRAQGLCGAWRNEQLAVHSAAGQRLGTVERAAVRPLGISTQAVHLMGFVSVSGPDSHIWVQQRALDKSNDPGLWDTLMGGMVGDSDSLAGALERETWEEAGLRLTQLRNVVHGGRVSLRRPTREARHAMADAGYMVEHIDWFRCSVPAGVRPVNQDGEVAQFVLLERRELLDRLQRDEFTTEAALVLLAALGM
jgi:8-oxo-dGTP pyrophosphatase MutT (NUDIX family)